MTQEPSRTNPTETSSAPLAVVTGGAQGIGLAIVDRLVDDGWRVAILDKDGEGAAAAADRAGAETCRGFTCDITDRDQVSAVVDQVQAEFGDVTALVSNAGWSPFKLFHETSDDEQQRAIDINFVGALHVTRALLPMLVSASGGRIVYVSSDAARVGVSGEAVYAGAKAALVGFAKSLALEVGRSGVTVNVVSPGTTDTPLLRSLYDEAGIEKRARRNPMGRIGKPEDIAGAVAYFCSDSANYVSGQVLSVSGALSRVG